MNFICLLWIDFRRLTYIIHFPKGTLSLTFSYFEICFDAKHRQFSGILLQSFKFSNQSYFCLFFCKFYFSLIMSDFNLKFQTVAKIFSKIEIIRKIFIIYLHKIVDPGFHGQPKKWSFWVKLLMKSTI